MIRRFGTPPEKGVHYHLRPGAYAVLERQGRILLTYQEEPEPEFQIPGGGIDPGEHMIPALRREIMEETGWSIAAPVRLGVFRQFVFMPDYDKWADKMCHVFYARPARKLGEPTEQGHTCHWVSPNKALHLVSSPGAHHFLASIL